MKTLIGCRKDLESQVLKGTFLDGNGSSVEKLLADRFRVVGFEELDNPLPYTFVGGISKLDVELDIPLDVKALILPPLAANLPFRLALEEVKVVSFWLGNDDGEQLPVLGVASLLNLLIEKQSVQLILDGLDWHLLWFEADFARASYHSAIIVTEAAKGVKVLR